MGYGVLAWGVGCWCVGVLVWDVGVGYKIWGVGVGYEIWKVKYKVGCWIWGMGYTRLRRGI